VFGVWVKVPCIRDFGSCIYEDLCNYGYDEDTTCPASFIQDRVPCRCPIEKVGNFVNLNYLVFRSVSAGLPELPIVFLAGAVQDS
jgi:hypothetical protein